MRNEITSAINNIESLKKEIEYCNKNIASLTEEKKSEKLGELGKTEQTELNTLIKECNDLEKQVIKASKERAKLEAKKREMEHLLNTNLQRQLVDIDEKKSQLSTHDDELKLKETTSELEAMKNNIIECNKKVKQLESEIKELNVVIKETKKQLDETNEEQKKASVEFKEIQQKLEKLLSKAST